MCIQEIKSSFDVSGLPIDNYIVELENTVVKPATYLDFWEGVGSD